jgi:UDP-glucose 4-epimerase
VRILVTGGAGFIGSHVVETFLQASHEVVVVDDLSSGREKNLPDQVTFQRMDIRSQECSRLIADFRPHALAHLAAQIDVRKSVADPVLDADINVLGLIRLARAATAAGTELIIFSSTGGAIYGEQEVFPAAEEHPCRPVSPYGTSKLCGEQYLEYFRRAGGPAFVALRYANVYGPRQDPHGEAGVVAIFAGKLLRREAPVIFGDGTQTRDYVYVKDVARSNLNALERRAEGIINIGTGIETDVNTLASMMCGLTGFEGRPRYLPARAGEQQRSSVDPAHAENTLGWRPDVTLEQGLRETVEFFRADLEV